MRQIAALERPEHHERAAFVRCALSRTRCSVTRCRGRFPRLTQFLLHISL